ncbi:MAG TPA: GNAT family N-acetyltransferase [Synergistaceae bacterium]|nr:GNAT family N-acetyltransferase [Synergistaceae bacterium]HPJ24973.1 GNAT family N-acetyltransferase [Synergistaceae bacterium]HPQ36821.1 GNAT family N-acetyltransferase [Synergistaceae bacterium]
MRQNTLFISLRLLQKASEEEIEALYRHAGWWRDDWDRSFISPMIRGSFLFAGAFCGGRQVGMGRVLSDGISDAYIQDVVVLREFRGQSIGSRIISFLVKELQQRNIDWIGLIGEPGTKNFYEQLGFREMTGFLPMRLS